MKYRYQIIGLPQSQPILALPDLSIKLRLAALRKYRPFTMRRRFFVRVVSASIITRLDRLLFRKRDDPLGLRRPFDFAAWLDQLARDSGVAGIPMVIWPKQAERNRLYVHFMDRHGSSTAFVKIAVDSTNDASLLAEAEAVRRINREIDPKSFRIPQLRSSGQFCGHRYTVYDPLPENGKYAPPTTALIQEWADELGRPRRIDAQDLVQLKWWSECEAATRRANNEAFAEDVSNAGSGTLVRPGHGDLGINNIVYSAPHFWIFDWEDYNASTPAFVDSVGFYLSTHRRRVLRDPRRAVHEFLSTFNGVNRSELAVAVAYLARNGIDSAISLARAWTTRAAGD